MEIKFEAWALGNRCYKISSDGAGVLVVAEDWENTVGREQLAEGVVLIASEGRRLIKRCRLIDLGMLVGMARDSNRGYACIVDDF